MNSRFLLTLVLFLCTSLFLSLDAQVTTATLYGNVADDNGGSMVAATVVAKHEPSGTIYGTTTREDGGFTLPNLRIGGPYTVTASFIGYQEESVGNIQLAIGQKEKVNFTMRETATSLDEVVVLAVPNSVINRDRTGAATNISSKELRALPTISRNTADFYRLTPSASGNSFQGRNDQYNNFSLDGSIFNNPFGLDAATPGGQTDAAPIPLDAIEQVQVSLSPFDVTQAGFTGAAINTVTKSGTNDFSGTAFVVFRNQDFTGSKVSGQDIFVPDLEQLQTGVSIGGPLVKNKLFFQATFELSNRDDLGSNFLAAAPGRSGENVSRVEAADLEAVSTALKDKFGYETGAYENYIHATDNTKGLIKLDYQVNQNHTVTAKYNFLDASKDKPAHPSAIGRRGPDATTLQFRNSGYRINNIIHSGFLEWKSMYGNKISNKLSAGFTTFKDSRDAFSTPIPVININKDGIRYIVAGHEPFSINNRLDQDVLQFSNNLSIYQGDHTITVGTSLERFNFDNSFNLGVYDPFTYGGGTFGPGFGSVQEFVETVNSGGFDEAYDHAQGVAETNNTEDSWALAETNVGQWAIYAQDEWAVSDQLTLTYGLRVDVPLYFDTDEKIQENIDRQCCVDQTITYFDIDGNERTFDHTVLPDQTPLFSPRIGFNYDMRGDQTVQLRGGSGLFTGRFPFVWIGNHVANPNSFFYNYTETDFKFPQVWKTNLGYDQQFGGNWLATVDLIYNKDINAMMVRNFGLRPPTGRLSGIDNRPVYDPVADRNAAGNNAYVFTNVDEGYSFNATVKLARDWGRNFNTSLAYNYGLSKDVSSIEAEISSDAYERNPAFGNVNEANLAHSLYGNRHRVVGTLWKRFDYGEGKWATTLSAFFEYAEGNRFSYTYSGDINGDGSGLNDLIFVPTDAQLNEQNFSSDEQREAFRSFIEQDEYLSGRRGDYAEKYAILTPWYNTWDVRIMQDFNFSVGERTNTLQFTVDILNLGSLISSDWGVREFPVNTQPVGVSFDGNGDPVYSFDPTLTSTFTDDFSLLSRWQMQLGLRYIF